MGMRPVTTAFIPSPLAFVNCILSIIFRSTFLNSLSSNLFPLPFYLQYDLLFQTPTMSFVAFSRAKTCSGEWCALMSFYRRTEKHDESHRPQDRFPGESGANRRSVGPAGLDGSAGEARPQKGRAFPAHNLPG